MTHSASRSVVPKSGQTEIVRIPFHGTDLLAVEIDGRPHVVLKPAIETLGIDYDNQRKKLDGKTWATKVLTTLVAADGKVREMLAVDVRTFLMLLATIDERRVSDAVRPLLVAYQSEVADVIEAYWTQGGAINPRATQEQLAGIIQRAEGQARVLRALVGVVDHNWLDAKGRHVAARALGEEPEIDPSRRPLTIGEYLVDRGLAGAALRAASGKFGKEIAGLYRQKHGTNPPKVERFVDGALRQVNGYTEQDRPIFDKAFAQIFAAAGGAR